MSVRVGRRARLAVVVEIVLLGAVLAGGTAARSAPSPPSADDDPGLQRLAEGRAAAVEIVRDAAPVDLAGIAARWDPPPAPAELPDWVASLLTDGTLDARFDDDGVARFCLGAAGEESPRVTVDLAEFDRAQQVRDAALRDDDAP